MPFWSLDKFASAVVDVPSGSTIANVTKQVPAKLMCVSPFAYDVAHTAEWLLYAIMLAHMFFTRTVTLIIASCIYVVAMLLTDKYTVAYKSAVYRTVSCDVIVYLV